MFGSTAYGIEPDIMTVAKALSGAYQPIAAVLLSAPLVAGLRSQSVRLGNLGHAFTTSAHPVAVAAAVRAVDLIAERDILAHVRTVSRDLPLPACTPSAATRSSGRRAASASSARPSSARTWPPVGASLRRSRQAVRALCQARGLIIRATGATDSLCFAPPLIITEAELHEMFDIVAGVLDDVASRVAAGELSA